MTIETTLRAHLVADLTLSALLTGGLYAFDALGPLGLSRSNQATAAAFDDGEVLPCAVVKARGAQPSGGIADPNRATRSIRQVVEVYLYQAGGYATIESAAARIRALLDMQVVDGLHLTWQGNPFGVNFDERELGGVYILRSDYAVHVIIKETS